MTIQKKCALEKDIELKKKYYTEVVEMERKVSNRLEKQHTRRAANLLKNINSWLESNKDLFKTKNVNTSQKTFENCKAFIFECEQQFEQIKDNYNNTKDKKELKNYIDKVIHIKKELNELPPKLKIEDKDWLLEQIYYWLEDIKKPELKARSKSLNTKNIRRDSKFDEIKNYSSFFEKFNYEFNKLKKEFENSKETDKKIDYIIEVSKIEKKVGFIKVGFIKDKKQRKNREQIKNNEQIEDLLNKIKKC